LKEPAVLAFILIPSAIALALVCGVYSAANSRCARDPARRAALRMWMLVAVQAFRWPLALAMHRMFERGIMPEVMSYSGRNLDIVTGITAVPVALLLRARLAGRRTAALWNLPGLALLLNVVSVAILATPVFAFFGPEQLNVWVTQPPFIWLPTVSVVAALAGHIIVLKALNRSRIRTEAAWQHRCTAGAVKRQAGRMAELLVSYDTLVSDEFGAYQARAIGRQAADRMWEGWLEFVPSDGRGEVLVSGVESRQPERDHLVYWATGLTPIYLEGALQRAREPLTVHVRGVEEPVSQAPAPRLEPVVTRPAAIPEPVLDPFDVGSKSLDILRQELGALNRPRLLNIIYAFDLNASEDVSWMSDAQLVHFIVVAVDARLLQQRRA
jgi:hypothetical protein